MADDSSPVNNAAKVSLSGWDYLNAVKDSWAPALQIGAYAFIAATAAGVHVAISDPIVVMPVVVIFVTQVGSYLQQIISGARPSMQA